MDDPDLQEPPMTLMIIAGVILMLIPAEESDLSDELDQGDIELTAGRVLI